MIYLVCDIDARYQIKYEVCLMRNIEARYHLDMKY